MKQYRQINVCNFYKIQNESILYSVKLKDIRKFSAGL